MAAYTEPVPGRRESPAVRWAKDNLFGNWYNALLTVVFGVLFLWGGFTLLRWVFFRAEWEIVRVNLTLFMVGRFPRDELARIWVSNYLIAGAIGVMIGASTASAAVAAKEAGFPYVHSKPQRMGPAVLADPATRRDPAAVQPHLDADHPGGWDGGRGRRRSLRGSPSAGERAEVRLVDHGDHAPWRLCRVVVVWRRGTRQLGRAAPHHFHHRGRHRAGLSAGPLVRFGSAVESCRWCGTCRLPTSSSFAVFPSSLCC